MNSNHPDTIINCYWFDKSQVLKGIPQPCYITVDSINDYKPDMINVYVQVEPRAICGNTKQYLIQNYHKYHTIFTYDEDVLKHCPNALFYVYGTLWIPEIYYKNIDISKKTFKISTLAGSKDMGASGHKFRKTIHHNQDKLKDFPIIFYRSNVQLPHLPDYNNNPLLPTDPEYRLSKFPLFETFQFSIVIENSRQTNYFTEKLTDCLITKTIPIYYGCPNIGDFFDISGWIIIENDSVEELKEKLNILNEDYYDKYLDVIEKNYNTTLYYKDVYINLNNAKSLNPYMK